MKDKCTILCADNLCIHNRANGHCYSVCALSELSGGTYGGITRSYVNTCPKKEPIPNCIARGPGKISVFYHGRAGNGKSTLDLERTFKDLRLSADDPGMDWTEHVTTIAEPRFYTADEIIADIQKLVPAIKAVPKPTVPPEFQRVLLGKWHFTDEEEV